MCNYYTPKQICLMNRLRLLWSQHVYRTRLFIISSLSDLGDLNTVTEKLLENPKDFARVLAKFYCPEDTESFRELFTKHLLIAAKLVSAAKNNDSSEYRDARNRWYENADEIACLLSQMNPCWDRTEWKSMLRRHLDLTEKEASLRLQGKYEEDSANFDRIEKEAMEMADCMFCGIVKNRCI